MKLKNIQEFWSKHKYKLALALLGLLVAVLFLTIGFFRTLLIIVLTGLCFGYGYLIDKFGFIDANREIGAFFKKLFGRR
ncbi:MAG: DUF2273 domain-containing protein [Clostridia bacterium]|nr:DUF2273 domain-containing protein [Clostridia bacterium]MBQ2110901.1 DUF2273 domain-containing protein [Clostridia bacterium]MBQ2191355.1 DUF2273 domain-containing protein [Clostridia bacterium]MBQ3937773.1 DUF2273 domain-containing protein [Clostridia bacterium]MBQ5487603.1 DUF2273 domain-containing protein [Clostridia bacterium]